MKKIIILLGAGFLVFCSLPPGSVKGDEKIVELVKNTKPAVVLIRTFDANVKHIGSGSGFFVDSNGCVITNHHVIERAYSATVRTTAGKEFPVKGIVGKDKEADVVKLAVSIADANIPYLKLSTSLPLEGQDVVVIGNPLGLEASVSTGIVSAVRDISVFGNIIQMTAPVSPGSSGSPVLNTKGEVIGVATFILTKGQNLNFTIPSDKILALKEIPKALTLKEYADQTSKIDPNSAESLYQAGLKELWQGNFADALTYFQKATEKDPQHDSAWFDYGYSCDKLGRHAEAIKCFDRALAINPHLPGAWNNKGLALGGLGKFEDAVRCYDRALDINPDLPAVLINKGVALMNLGKFEEAIQCYEKALTINKDFAPAWFNKGNTLRKARKFEEAVKCYDQALAINPDFADAWCNKGVSLMVLVRFEEAIQCFDRFLTIKPAGAVLAWYNKGVSLYYLKRYAEARQYFQKAADLGDSGARQALDMLSKEGH